MDLQGTSAAMTVASMAGAGVATAAAAAADAAGGMTAVSTTVGTCLRCQAGGGDVQVVGCGCCLHAVRLRK